MQTGGTIAAPKAGFDEKALIEKVKAHRKAMKETPEEGKSDVAKTKQEAAEARFGEEKQSEPKEEFSADQIEDAELSIRSELGMRQAGTTPGRYYIENELGEYNPQRERSASKGVTSGGHWLGVKGLQNLKYTAGFTPTEIETALRRRAGRVYDTLITRAVRSSEEVEKATSFNPQEFEGGLADETGLRAGPQIALPEEETPKLKKKARK